MDRQTVQYMRQVIEGAIEQALIDEGYTVKVKLGNARFDTSSVTFQKLSIVEGTSAEAKRHEFERDCWKVGLNSKHYQQDFVWNGERFRLVGISPTRRKYPLQVLKLSDGKKYGGPKAMLPAILEAWAKSIEIEVHDHSDGSGMQSFKK